jgi:hypothetical protein
MGIPPAIEHGANRVDAPSRAHYGTTQPSTRLDSSETFPAHDLPSRVPTLIDLTSSLPPHPPDRSAQVECSTWHSALGTTN